MFLEEKDDLFRKIMPTEDFSRLLKKRIMISRFFARKIRKQTRNLHKKKKKKKAKFLRKNIQKKNLSKNLKKNLLKKNLLKKNLLKKNLLKKYQKILQNLKKNLQNTPKNRRLLKNHHLLIPKKKKTPQTPLQNFPKNSSKKARFLQKKIKFSRN